MLSNNLKSLKHQLQKYEKINGKCVQSRRFVNHLIKAGSYDTDMRNLQMANISNKLPTDIVDHMIAPYLAKQHTHFEEPVLPGVSDRYSELRKFYKKGILTFSDDRTMVRLGSGLGAGLGVKKFRDFPKAIQTWLLKNAVVILTVNNFIDMIDDEISIKIEKGNWRTFAVGVTGPSGEMVRSKGRMYSHKYDDQAVFLDAAGIRNKGTEVLDSLELVGFDKRRITSDVVIRMVVKDYKLTFFKHDPRYRTEEFGPYSLLKNKKYKFCIAVATTQYPTQARVIRYEVCDPPCKKGYECIEGECFSDPMKPQLMDYRDHKTIADYKFNQL